LLGEFWTGLALPEGGLFSRIARRLQRWPQLAGLSTRIVTGVPAEKLHTMPLVEIAAVRRLRAGENSTLTLHERNRKFQEKIPGASLAANDAVIAFDTSAWILGERAQQSDRPLFLDRTTTHPAAYARIMAGFYRQYPAWASPITARPAEVSAAESREHTLARRIIVGSSFARDTLVQEGVAAEKIRVNPYGVDWDAFAPPPPSHPITRPFRFLFVGSVQASKGIPVLLDAWRRLALPNAELWIAGGVGPRERTLIPDLPGLKILGQIPRAQIPALYAQADVFVFPSMFEGFGLVLLEALASGLPIIATRHTGAVDLLAEPSLGELITAGSVDELAGAMQRWLGQPEAYRRKILAARGQLAAKYSWTAYGDRWAEILKEKL
jgi:glycosyltransferase involved in cell wall biosynthesis